MLSCILYYHTPVLATIILGFLISILIAKCIQKCLDKQTARIKKERRLKLRKDKR